MYSLFEHVLWRGRKCIVTNACIAMGKYIQVSPVGNGQSPAKYYQVSPNDVQPFSTMSV
jgi:hypothetical protein